MSEPLQMQVDPNARFRITITWMNGQQKVYRRCLRPGMLEGCGLLNVIMPDELKVFFVPVSSPNVKECMIEEEELKAPTAHDTSVITASKR